ncbi:MAG TPA: BTAD domain-containing putative transcriptional regulator, partial [Candidatus Polarisedimenticolaceae bacterium]|nr:BTAD domain-containing putative transcriptional regulator [Candidatus Polarisedimenticolaceae bacterium]
HPNRVVPTGRLIDEVWGEAAPDTARAALQGYVAGLRKALGSGAAPLRTQAPGYVLEVGPEALDLDRFESMRAEARATADPARRAALLHAALALWRDVPLSEFDGEPFAAVAAEQLEERRLGALEERIDADLAVGRHGEVVAELDALVAEQPYRERFRAQQMLALYRSGRQADALAAYRATREAFASGLGLEPGSELKALERAVLEQDPVLDPPRVEPGPVSATRARHMPRDSRILVRAAAIGVVAVFGLALLVVLAADDPPSVEVLPNSVAVIDPAANKVIDSIQVGIRPGPIAAEAGSLWIGNLVDKTLMRIDTRSRRPAGTVSLDGRTPTGLAVDRGTVWVAHGLLGSVSVVDAQFGDVTRAVPVTTPGAYWKTGAVAAGAGTIWAVFGDGTLARLDRPGGDVRGRTQTNASPAGLAVGYGSVWVASASRSTVQRFSPISLAELSSSTVGSRPAAVALGFGDVWVASAGADLVYRIEVGGGSIAATIEVGEGPSAIAVDADTVWVVNAEAGTVERIDPGTNTVTKTIEVGGAPAGVVVADGLVWVTVQPR